MSASVTALAYLIAAILFILALRGLSNPETARQGNRFGMVGNLFVVGRLFGESGGILVSRPEPPSQGGARD